MFASGNVRHDGPTASCDQNPLGRVLGSADLDRMWVHQPRRALHEIRPSSLEQALVDLVQARDLAVLVGQQRGPIERGFGRPSVTPRVLEIVREVGSIDEELLRNAPDIDTGATHAIHLGDRHPRAELARHSRRPHPAGSGANDEEVVVVFSHSCSPRNLGHGYG